MLPESQMITQIVIEDGENAVLIELADIGVVTTTHGTVFGRHFCFNPADRQVWTRRDSVYVDRVFDDTRMEFDEQVCREFLGFDNEVNHGV